MIVCENNGTGASNAHSLMHKIDLDCSSINMLGLYGVPISTWTAPPLFKRLLHHYPLYALPEAEEEDLFLTHESDAYEMIHLEQNGISHCVFMCLRPYYGI